MDFAESFDYVVVGAGAAGAIVARRLAEDPAVSVCLLEAGPPDHNPYLHLPAWPADAASPAGSPARARAGGLSGHAA